MGIGFLVSLAKDTDTAEEDMVLINIRHALWKKEGWEEELPFVFFLPGFGRGNSDDKKRQHASSGRLFIHSPALLSSPVLSQR